MDNKIYYNVNIPYDDARPCDGSIATIQYDSSETILKRGNDYQVEVLNFSIPVSSVPICFADVCKPPNTDPNKTIYQVALEYNGVVHTESVIYTPNDSFTAPPNSPFRRSMYYAVYTYTQMVNMINTAFTNAFVDMPEGAVPPLLKFDPNTNRFNITYDPDFYCPIPLYSSREDSNSPDTVKTDPKYNKGYMQQKQTGKIPIKKIDPCIKVYMNYYLYQFFVGFDVLRTGYLTPDARDFQFNFNSNATVIEQDYSTISNWNCLRTLQLRAPGMNVAEEYIPSSQSGSDLRAARASILASFTPIYSNSVGSSTPRSQIVFTLQGAHRLIDVITSNPLKTISLEVWWSDEKNNSYPLALNYRELVTTKLCFHLRSSYAG